MKEDYGVGLEQRSPSCRRRIRRLGYRPKPARRVYIPKGDGRSRPFGIPSLEDRLVQDRLSAILQRSGSQNFVTARTVSTATRAHQALLRLAEIVTRGRAQWVVEVDIKGFFDHVSHIHLMQFLEHTDSG